MASVKRKISIRAAIEILTSGRIQIYLAGCALMVYFLKHTALAGLFSLYYFNSFELSETQATVTNVVEVEDGENYLYEFKFRFHDEFEQPFENYSYAAVKNLQSGQSVTVEFVMSNPEYARIKGYRYNVKSDITIIILTMVLILLSAWPIKRVIDSIVQIRLLKTGQLAEARFQGTVKIDSSDKSEETLYQAIFSFTDDNKKACYVHHKTFEAHFDKKGKYHAFYDKDNSSNALILEMLPGSAHLGEDGSIIPDESGRYIWLIWLPVVYIAAWFV